MSLYQVSTRASRRRRIGAWLRERWNRRAAAARHDRTGDLSSRYAYVPKVVRHAFVPPNGPLSAHRPDADVDALVESQSTVKISVPTVKQRPGSGRPSAAHKMVVAADGDVPVAPPDEPIGGTPRVPQQRPPRRTPSVFPNAYRAR